MYNYEFVVWLEGYLDLCEKDVLTPKKLRIIRNHLNLVKVVEGTLGEFNTSIDRLISKAIEDNSDTIALQDLKEDLKNRVEGFLVQNFPEGRLYQSN